MEEEELRAQDGAATARLTRACCLFGFCVLARALSPLPSLLLLLLLLLLPPPAAFGGGCGRANDSAIGRHCRCLCIVIGGTYSWRKVFDRQWIFDLAEQRGHAALCRPLPRLWIAGFG